MTKQVSPFFLTYDDMENGISSERMTAYAGYPVHVAALDAFPYFQELRENRSLFGPKLKQRRIAVAQYMDKIRFPKSNAHINSIAASWSAHNYSTTYRIDIDRLQVDASGGWNPHKLNKRYLIPARLWKLEFHDRWVVAPKPISGNLDKHFTEPMLKERAIVLLEPRGEAPEVFWAAHTWLPPERITNTPDTRTHRLKTGLHEMRHLAQLYGGAPHYREIDSELYARFVVREQLPLLDIESEKPLRVDGFTRYAGLLASTPTHQVAPYIEAYESRKAPPDIGEALRYINRSIIQKETGKIPELSNNQEEFRKRCEKEPELIYSLLRRCMEDGMFRQNPLVTHIANRVLESVEYFSEGLTRSPGIVNKVYAFRQMI